MRHGMQQQPIQQYQPLRNQYQPPFEQHQQQAMQHLQTKARRLHTQPRPSRAPQWQQSQGHATTAQNVLTPQVAILNLGRADVAAAPGTSTGIGGSAASLATPASLRRIGRNEE